MADQTDSIAPAADAAPATRRPRRWPLRLLGWFNIVGFCLGVGIGALNYRMLGGGLILNWLFPALFLPGVLAAWSGDPSAAGFLRILRVLFAAACFAVGLFACFHFLGVFLQELFELVAAHHQASPG